MSTFNNMENVPVKISEKYKPPPRVFQMPQAIANKLMLPPNYYHEAPQYCYDFQLERKVLAKIPEWRQMRQAEREARRERIEKREEQRLLALETQHKQLLGTVSYPSAEELSSTESEDEEIGDNKNILVEDGKPVVATTQINSFHNILQPTILPPNVGFAPNEERITEDAIRHKDNVITTGKPLNTFNYKDFEEDTSSPFDNIELKTINDLDILAQVLKNTELKSKESQEDKIEVTDEEETKENNLTLETMEKEGNQNVIQQASINIENSVNNRELVQSTQFQNENIPNASSNDLIHTIPMIGNHIRYPTIEYTITANHQTNYMPYQQQQKHQYGNFNMPSNLQELGNRNYLYSTHCNGSDNVSATNAYFNPMHTQAYAGSNANGIYLEPLQTTGNQGTVFFSPQNAHSLITDGEGECSSKSKSVPDIIKELRDEVNNSEKRRAHKHNHRADESGPVKSDGISMSIVNTNIDENVAIKNQESSFFKSLEPPTQKLAKNISSMGFPLERVAKIAKIFGADDKKIVEHLIPLSELMDLGFDESQISEALLKFDNNKEKALDYLIT